MQKTDKKILEEIIRVDHAGERGAIKIYEGQLLALKTIKQDEIFGLEAQELLYRLYHQEEVRIFVPQSVQFKCSCSTENVLNAITQIGKEEIQDILNQDGAIATTCDFCLTTYRFDESDFVDYFSDKKH